MPCAYPCRLRFKGQVSDLPSASDAMTSAGSAPDQLIKHAQVALEEEGESQRVRLSTTLPGKLLLHWGVQGGADYQGGWRLPGPDVVPEGTVRYKDRALQTPWRYCPWTNAHAVLT